MLNSVVLDKISIGQDEEEYEEGNSLYSHKESKEQKIPGVGLDGQKSVTKDLNPKKFSPISFCFGIMWCVGIRGPRSLGGVAIPV